LYGTWRGAKVDVSDMKNARAEIAIELSSKRHAEAIHKALRPETRHSIGPRSKVAILLTGKTLRIDVFAKDIPALRAAVNSYLRWVSGSATLIQEVDRFEPKRQTACPVTAKAAS